MNLIKTVLITFILTLNFQLSAIELEFPLDCKLGETCWISNLPRHYLKNKQVDFRCGPNTYNDHKGTDFALKNYTQMQDGVSVLAPFDGEVRGVRDNVDDISVKELGKNAVKGIECGNGIVIGSGEYEAQLCHLKKGSLTVKKGQTVKAGEVIALVGLSGQTEYPHLHLSLRKDSNEIDPIYGDQEDSAYKPKSMWQDDEKMNLNAKTGVVYNYGFTFDSTNIEQIRKNQHIKIQPDFPHSLVGYVAIFSVEKGDKLVLSIVDNENKIIIKRDHNFGKYQARYFFYIGKSLRGKKISGDYKLNIKYYHHNGKIENFSKGITL
jgi:murein DD-endopeptidase MepM/ murein hydrolase activator NlpD